MRTANICSPRRKKKLFTEEGERTWSIVIVIKLRPQRSWLPVAVASRLYPDWSCAARWRRSRRGIVDVLSSFLAIGVCNVVSIVDKPRWKQPLYAKCPQRSPGPPSSRTARLFLFRSCIYRSGLVLKAKKGDTRAVNGEFRDRGVFAIGLPSQRTSSRATIHLLPSDSRARERTAGAMHQGGVNASWLCISGKSSWTDTQAESKRAGLPPIVPRGNTKTWRSSVDRRGRGGLRVAEVTVRRGVHRNEMRWNGTNGIEGHGRRHETERNRREIQHG